MEILFVTTELQPFVKVGGLADVSAALPKALRMLGHSVTVALPRYPALEEGGLLVARRLTPLKFTLGERAFDVTVFDGRLASQVDLVLIDAPGLFDRGGVYGTNGRDFSDNAVRFGVLSRAAAEVARQRAAAGRPFDIIHANDWPTALSLTHVQDLAKETRELARTKSVLTIHNVAHQGIFPRESLTELGLGWDRFNLEGIEFYGQLNVLKQGIVSADAVTTVSPTYAREIQTAAGGEKLDGVLRAKEGKVFGITNGVDYAVWNPATDPALAARYDAEDFANKTRCKGALQKELGLPIDGAAPLFASIGRLAPQKGTDLIAALLPKLLRATDAQMVIAGDGDPELAAALEAAVAKAHGRAVFVRAASEATVHRIFGAADFVLIPSRFEPCGLVQLYAQRYGALPIARATGGLVDTIVDCDANLETGTGFLFEGDAPDVLLGAAERAVAARGHARWGSLVRRVMRTDRGWDRPARRYEQVYRSLATT